MIGLAVNRSQYQGIQSDIGAATPSARAQKGRPDLEEQ
jgi:hypothetical protein